MQKLPVDDFESIIVASLKENPSLVLSAETGAGKSTRVPQFLFKHFTGKTLLLEPRRVAARSIAKRIAQELGVELGKDEVGYQIRFENKSSSKTKLKVITEGILLQILQSNATLEGIECVVLDEFHERNLYTDLALACCLEIQKNYNPNLKIVVMSATLNAEALKNYLNAQVLDIPGRTFPVKIFYAPPPDKKSQFKFLEQKVKEKLDFVLSKQMPGDILVFLPGLAEILRTKDLCQDLFSKNNILPLLLHSSLDATEQDKIFQESSRRKVILATNIAETSLTIPGVKIVIDSGVEKNPLFDLDFGASKLVTENISLFSAKQRAGRAGRVSEGTCYRLWSEDEEESFESENTPQIMHSDLSLNFLLLMNWRGSLEDFQWFESPPPKLYKKTIRFLEDLKLIEKNKLSEDALKMLEKPFSLRSKALLCQNYKSEALDDLQGLVAKLERMSLSQVKDVLLKNLKTSNQGLSFKEGVLRAFADRVGVFKSSGRIEVLHGYSLSSDASFNLKPGDILIVLEIEFKKQGLHWDRKLKDYILIDEKILKSQFPLEIEKRKSSFWDEEKGKPRVIEALYFRDLAIEVGREIAPDPETKMQALTDFVLSHLDSFREKFSRFNLTMNRILFLKTHNPALWKELDFDSNNFKDHLQFFMPDIHRVSDIDESWLLKVVSSFLSEAQRKNLEKDAPEILQLPNSPKPCRLRYEDSGRVVASARLKDFWGLQNLPEIGGGKVKILAELLAPNFRPVQITTDLESFWKNTYPEVKKELKARYPKHFKDLP